MDQHGSLIEIYYGALTSPVGRVMVAATAKGLACVSFRTREPTFVAGLGRRFGARAVRSDKKTARFLRQIEDYFAGKRLRFDLPVDLRGMTPFQRRVLRATALVPAGQVISYGELARRIGRPQSSRAVGQALGRNPLPIVIPCHRIVSANGGLGGYTGGIRIKKQLLRIEGASSTELFQRNRKRKPGSRRVGAVDGGESGPSRPSPIPEGYAGFRAKT